MGEVGCPDKTILCPKFVWEVMEHQHALAETIGAHLKASAVAGEGIQADGPLTPCVSQQNLGGLTLRILRIVLSVIEDDFKKPIPVWMPREIFVRLAWRLVAILDPF